MAAFRICPANVGTKSIWSGERFGYSVELGVGECSACVRFEFGDLPREENPNSEFRAPENIKTSIPRSRAV
jgi:hypothetical protein